MIHYCNYFFFLFLTKTGVDGNPLVDADERLDTCFFIFEHVESVIQIAIYSRDAGKNTVLHKRRIVITIGRIFVCISTIIIIQFVAYSIRTVGARPSERIIEHLSVGTRVASLVGRSIHGLF